MQPTRFEKAVRWLLLVGFVIMSGAGNARSNCCCVTLAGTASCETATATSAKKPCCQGKSNQCDSAGCDSSKCSSLENCSAECGCSITDAPQLSYKETESPVSKIFVAESPLETTNRFLAVSVENPLQDRSDPAINAQVGCSLMCTWQK